MTIQEAIAKAIEGGYPKERLDNLSVPVQAQCFLERLFEKVRPPRADATSAAS
jgi:hypothetical protein